MDLRTPTGMWTRVFPAIAALAVASVGTVAEAATALPALQIQTATAGSLATAHTGGLHAQLWFRVSDMIQFMEPHGAKPCGGMGHIAFLGVIALIVIAAMRFRFAASAARIDLARRMVERGMNPPAEIFSSSPRNDLRRGLVLLGAGAGLLAYGFASNPDTPSVAGLIPAFIGIGYLLSHRFARGTKP